MAAWRPIRNPGWAGCTVTSGIKLAILRAEQRQTREGDLSSPGWTQPTGKARVVVEPQNRFFAASIKQRFLTQGFKLSAAYDRMGVRLSGPPLPANDALDMLSEPILPGSIQIAGDGVAGRKPDLGRERGCPLPPKSAFWPKFSTARCMWVR